MLQDTQPPGTQGMPIVRHEPHGSIEERLEPFFTALDDWIDQQMGDSDLTDPSLNHPTFFFPTTTSPQEPPYCRRIASTARTENLRIVTYVPEEEEDNVPKVHGTGALKKRCREIFEYTEGSRDGTIVRELTVPTTTPWSVRKRLRALSAAPSLPLRSSLTGTAADPGGPGQRPLFQRLPPLFSLRDHEGLDA